MIVDVSMISTQNAMLFPIIHQACGIGRPLLPGSMWLENNRRVMATLPVSPGPALCEEMLRNDNERSFDLFSPVGEDDTKPIIQTASNA